MGQNLLTLETAGLLLLLAGNILLIVYRTQVERMTTYLLNSEVTIENRGGEPYSPQDLSLGMILNTTTQTGYLIDCTTGCTMKVDVDGNPYLVFEGFTIQPGETATVTMSMRALTKTSGDQVDFEAGDLASISRELVEEYCRTEGPFQVNDSNLRSLAQSIKSEANTENTLELVKAVIGWIDANLHYETHSPPLYPNETLLARSGDCDEQANLLISLCRILEIPAYLQTGLVVKSNETITYLDGHYRSEGLVGHGWATVYIPPHGWMPVDMTYYDGSRIPVSHITTSAWARGLVVQTTNIAHMDYLVEWNDWAKSLYENGIYERDRYNLTELKTESYTKFPPNFIIGLGLVFSGLVITVVTKIYGQESTSRERGR